jgi:hypothetical protein
MQIVETATKMHSSSFPSTAFSARRRLSKFETRTLKRQGLLSGSPGQQISGLVVVEAASEF